MGPPRLLGLLLCGLLLRAAAAPVPEPVVRPKIFSPNPPACASEVADILADSVDLWTGIALDTVVCAQDLGWQGLSAYGNKKVWFFHNQRKCADFVIGQIAKVAKISSDLLAACFDCFNDNEGCGQSIASTINWSLNGIQTLVKAVNLCAPQYRNYPFAFNSDPPLQGFACWAKVWRVLQRIIKVAKFIDVSISVCERLAPRPIPIPGFQGDTTPPNPAHAAGGASFNTGSLSGGAGAGQLPAPPPGPGPAGPAPMPREAAGGEGEEDSLEDAGVPAGWGQLTQPEPFAPLGEQVKVAPAERRLRAAAGGGGNHTDDAEDAASLFARLELIRAAALDGMLNDASDQEEFERVFGVGEAALPDMHPVVRTTAPLNI